MEIKIGVQNSAREIVLESAQSAEEISSAVTAALKSGTVLTLADEKGRQVVIPAAALAYVELGVPTPRRVGFAGA